MPPSHRFSLVVVFAAAMSMLLVVRSQTTYSYTIATGSSSTTGCIQGSPAMQALYLIWSSLGGGTGTGAVNTIPGARQSVDCTSDTTLYMSNPSTSYPTSQGHQVLSTLVNNAVSLLGMSAIQVSNRVRSFTCDPTSPSPSSLIPTATTEASTFTTWNIDTDALGNLKKCIVCPTHCTVCSSTTVCTTCATNYRLASDQTCEPNPASIPNCVLAIIVGSPPAPQCSACGAGFATLGGLCIPTNPPAPLHRDDQQCSIDTGERAIRLTDGMSAPVALWTCITATAGVSTVNALTGTAGSCLAGSVLVGADCIEMAACTTAVPNCQICVTVATVENCVRCKTGYTLIVETTSTGTVLACQQSSPSAVNPVHPWGLTVGATACVDQHYLRHDGTCGSCPDDCISCVAQFKSGARIFCTACPSGLVLIDGRCTFIPGKCAVYAMDKLEPGLADGIGRSVICKYCQPGYVLVGFGCMPITSQTGCNLYDVDPSGPPNARGACVECQRGYYLSAGTCLPCDSTCAACNSPGPYGCSSCRQGLNPVVDTAGSIECMATVPQSSVVHMCVGVSPLDSTVCVECFLGYQPSLDGRSCLPINTVNNPGCFLLDPSTPGNKCIACNEGLVLINNKCRAPPAMSNCAVLDPTNSFKCQVCAVGAFKTQLGECRACPDHCDSCYQSITGSIVCTTCSPFYAPTSDRLHCQSCAQVPNCYLCDPTTPSACLVCKDGYSLNTTNNCQSKSVIDKCLVGSPISSDICIACTDGYELSRNQSSCVVNHSTPTPSTDTDKDKNNTANEQYKSAVVGLAITLGVVCLGLLAALYYIYRKPAVTQLQPTDPGVHSPDRNVLSTTKLKKSAAVFV